MIRTLDGTLSPGDLAWYCQPHTYGPPVLVKVGVPGACDCCFLGRSVPVELPDGGVRHAIADGAGRETAPHLFCTRPAAEADRARQRKDWHERTEAVLAEITRDRDTGPVG